MKDCYFIYIYNLFRQSEKCNVAADVDHVFALCAVACIFYVQYVSTNQTAAISD